MSASNSVTTFSQTKCQTQTSVRPNRDRQWPALSHVAMALGDGTTIERFAVEAIRLGAEALDVEYRDGCEEVVAVRGGVTA